MIPNFEESSRHYTIHNTTMLYFCVKICYSKWEKLKWREQTELRRIDLATMHSTFDSCGLQGDRLKKIKCSPQIIGSSLLCFWMKSCGIALYPVGGSQEIVP